MGKVFMWIGIILGCVLVILFFVSTIMPQSMADFFMSFGAADYKIEMENGEMREVSFSNLGDGVEPEDRLFVMKKMIAMHILSEYEPEYLDELAEFNDVLIAAAEDQTLSSVELLDLKKLHEDILPEGRVNDWIGMAKELEEQKLDKERGSEER